jgi:hypothetical protein
MIKQIAKDNLVYGWLPPQNKPVRSHSAFSAATPTPGIQPSDTCQHCEFSTYNQCMQACSMTGQQCLACLDGSARYSCGAYPSS